MDELESPHHLSRQTTPTWEVELLISAVAVFAMLQLPGWLDDQAFALLPRFGVDWAEPGKLLYMYAKSATVMLAITFALHLLLRAHWIAVVGTYSVYPDGVRWERLRMGPIQRHIEQARSGSASDVIDAADNRATVVFAMGVMLASVLVLLSIVLFLAYALAINLLHQTGLELDGGLVFVGCFTVLFLPFFAAQVMDRQFGALLAPGGRAAGALRRVIHAYVRLGLGRWSAPLRLMASHGSERKLMLLTMLIVGSVTSATILGYHYLRKPETMGDYGLFPDMGNATVSGAHYNDQRDPARDEIAPFIQGLVVLGPYLQVVVPYDPLRDAAALRVHCPASAGDDGTRRLACLADLHAISLDGQSAVTPGYVASSDARTNRPALLAMIDIRGLAPGRHEVHVARPPRSDRPVDNDDPGYDTIVFWR